MNKCLSICYLSLVNLQSPGVFGHCFGLFFLPVLYLFRWNGWKDFWALYAPITNFMFLNHELYKCLIWFTNIVYGQRGKNLFSQANISPFAEVSTRNDTLVVQYIIYLKMAVVNEFNLIFFLSHVGDLCHAVRLFVYLWCDLIIMYIKILMSGIHIKFLISKRI